MKHPEGFPGNFCTTDLPIATSDAQGRTATGTARTSSKLDHDMNRNHKKWAKKSMKDDCECPIDHSVRHSRKSASTQYTVWGYGYREPEGTVEPSSNIPM